MPQIIVVNVDVHAEMDGNVPDHSLDTLDTLDTVNQSTMIDENPVTKKLLMATDNQRRAYDEMFSIEPGIPWRTASRNLHRYRINEKKRFSTGSMTTSAVKIKVSRIYY